MPPAACAPACHTLTLNPQPCPQPSWRSSRSSRYSRRILAMGGLLPGMGLSMGRYGYAAAAPGTGAKAGAGDKAAARSFRKGDRVRFIGGGPGGAVGADGAGGGLGSMAYLRARSNAYRDGLPDGGCCRAAGLRSGWLPSACRAQFVVPMATLLRRWWRWWRCSCACHCQRAQTPTLKPRCHLSLPAQTTALHRAWQRCLPAPDPDLLAPATLQSPAAPPAPPPVPLARW